MHIFGSSEIPCSRKGIDLMRIRKGIKCFSNFFVILDRILIMEFSCLFYGRMYIFDRIGFRKVDHHSSSCCTLNGSFHDILVKFNTGWVIKVQESCFIVRKSWCLKYFCIIQLNKVVIFHSFFIIIFLVRIFCWHIHEHWVHIKQRFNLLLL